MSEKLCAEEFLPQASMDGIADTAANVATVASAVGGSGLVSPALGASLGLKAFQFLRGKYQKGASTAKYLATYIVDLTIILHEILLVLMVDPPRSLSEDIVKTLNAYKSQSAGIYAQLQGVIYSPRPEKFVEKVIRDALGMPAEA
ncbi:unnamed protein product [Cyclocybe aegerita]|uniref:Uncharacterized protein n=1 Tax=Cyclocybe aegerita TaxID=1973307 RepID=A0A8S0VVV1_CYCAE|nr:unnamed protein product [Cyclocybe aegerita]